MENKNKSFIELRKIKSIVNVIINLLEDNISNIKHGKFELNDNQKDLLCFLIGSKENVVSIITKLSNLLIKLDNVVEDNKNNLDNLEDIKFEDIDFELIDKFLKERKNNTNL